MRLNVLIYFVLLIQPALGQQPSSTYHLLVAQADSLYKFKLFEASADAYTNAFRENNWKGFVPHLYGAARAWAMVGNLDSAFRKLDRVITYSRHSEFNDYKDFEKEPAFQILHGDNRWEQLIRKANEKYNGPLVLQLNDIFKEDQRYRVMADSVFKNYGYNSEQGEALIRKMKVVDSVNLVAVKRILDQHGWLSVEEVGDTGNMAIFLVIQHADSATQVKYLPLMRDAVKNNKANPGHLALMEDRVALKQGRKQIYGSQIGFDKETGRYYVLPLEDPENVDARRKNVGLPPLSEYTQQWGFEWSLHDHIQE